MGLFMRLLNIGRQSPGAGTVAILFLPFGHTYLFTDYESEQFVWTAFYALLYWWLVSWLLMEIIGFARSRRFSVSFCFSVAVFVAGFLSAMAIWDGSWTAELLGKNAAENIFTGAVLFLIFSYFWAACLNLARFLRKRKPEN